MTFSLSLVSCATAKTPFISSVSVCWDDEVRWCDGEDDFTGLARPRRHGRPLLVRPRQVVTGFLESERERRDSGVLGIYGILSRRGEWTEGRKIVLRFHNYMNDHGKVIDIVALQSMQCTRRDGVVHGEVGRLGRKCSAVQISFRIRLALPSLSKN